jgi:outer membrane protein TolC
VVRTSGAILAVLLFCGGGSIAEASPAAGPTPLDTLAWARWCVAMQAGVVAVPRSPAPENGRRDGRLAARPPARNVCATSGPSATTHDVGRTAVGGTAAPRGTSAGPADAADVEGRALQNLAITAAAGRARPLVAPHAQSPARLLDFGGGLEGLAPLAPADRQGPEPATGPVAAPARLTLREAIDEALARNPDLLALRQQLEAEVLVPDQERFLMAPMVEAQAVEWPLDTPNPARAKLMVMASQQLPGRGKRALRVRLAEREAGVTRAALAVREQEIATEVKQAWADALLGRRTAETLRRSADLLRQLADVASAKYAAGRLTQQDVLKALVERSMLEEQIVMANEQARMATVRLNALLGRPPGDPLDLAMDAAGEAALPAAADLERLALERQPELAEADAEIARAEAALALVRRERAPDFVVAGGFMVMPDERNAWTARLGLTWPHAPWARGRIEAMERAAAAALDAARARRRALETRVRQMVHEAWVRADAAGARAALIRTSVVSQALHTMEITRVAYQADRADFLDVIDNQRRLLEAELQWHRAVADRDRAVADLERAVGRDIAPSSR